MDLPLRVLTVGMKSAVNFALAGRDDLRVAAMTEGETERWRKHGLEVLPYQLRKKLSLKAATELRAVVDEFRPEIVQTYGSRPLAHAVRGLSGMPDRPKIVSYRGVTSVPMRWRLEDRLTYLSPMVDAHACESHASMNGLLRAGVQRQRCFVAYNTLTEPPLRADDRQAYAEMGIPESATIAVMVANMRRVKGADILLEAARLLGDLEDLYFVFVGQVRDRRIEQLARDPAIGPRVRLTGFREDATQLISVADLFVMPSRAEALCVALLEAMHLGTCPVVSNAGGMKEAVRNGIDGVVVPSGSSDALAGAIRELYHVPDRRRAFGASAAERCADMFADARVAQRFADGYRAMLARTEASQPSERLRSAASRTA